MPNLIFDFDGTLCDSGRGIKNAINYSLNNNGFEILPSTALDAFIGPPLGMSYEKYITKDIEKIKVLIEDLRTYYKDKGVLEYQLYDNIPEILKELKNRGYQLFVATSKPTLFANQILDAENLTDLFIEVEGSGMEGDILEKTEILQNLVRKHPELLNQESWMIGDTLHDIHGGQYFKMNTIAVTYGYGLTDDLMNAKPSMVIHAPSEFLYLFN